MAKYRSKVDFLQVFEGDKEGFNVGLDGSVFVRKEATQRTFIAPRIGTQGSSVGDTAASTDISAGTDDSLKVAVDGGTVVDVTLTLAGLTTGAAIATELETQINTALAAAAQDGRVWVDFDGGDDHYEVYSQFTGTTSSVVITDATADNVADDLKLGTANGGTETAGTDDQDFLLYTTGGPTFEQPVESNPHRTGRFHTGVLKRKKVAEFDIDTLVNMSGSAGASIDAALMLLLESIFGTETVTASQSIKYTQGLPNFTFSMVRVSTIFAEYYTGAYCRDFTLTLPGESEATMKFTGKAAKANMAGIGQIDGLVSGSATVTLNTDHAKRFYGQPPVMIVGADGRTITAGADGSLTIDSISVATDEVVLSTTVDAEDDGFLVFWHPGAIQQTGRDNPYTDLEGSFKFNSSGSVIDTTQITLAFANDHVDLDNRFGRDANVGFVAGNRATGTLTVEFDLSNENLGDLVQAREFSGFAPEIILGDSATGRYLKITAPKWIPSIPPIDVPESGTTSISMEGNFYQSAPGARDPISVEWL